MKLSLHLEQIHSGESQMAADFQLHKPSDQTFKVLLACKALITNYFQQNRLRFFLSRSKDLTFV